MGFGLGSQASGNPWQYGVGCTAAATESGWTNQYQQSQSRKKTDSKSKHFSFTTSFLSGGLRKVPTEK